MRPNVNINLGNGSLGRIAQSSDGVAGLVLTGSEVMGKLSLGKHYQLSSTRDLVTLGIEAATNPLVHKEVSAFFAQVGDGAELHLIVVSQATTLTQMCDPADGSPLRKLLDASAGRVRIVGVNKIADESYTADLTEGIDGDSITAAQKAQQTGEIYAKKMRPFRLLMPASAYDDQSDKLYQPRKASYNRVCMVLASDDPTTKTAAIGMVLGRAAKIEPQQSLGRVKDGAIAPKMYLTNGQSHLEIEGKADTLHDAGYIIPIGYASKNGAYLNENPAAAPLTDDYGELHLGRIIDKASVIAYDTYISEIMDTIASEPSSGQLSQGACVNLSSMLRHSVALGMKNQISDFTVTIDPSQNILSTGVLEINCKITPLGILQTINVNLAFFNPANNTEKQ